MNRFDRMDEEFVRIATTDRGSALRLRYLQAALQATPSLAWRLAVEMTPDGLAVVLTSMTITRIMPEVILVGAI